MAFCRNCGKEVNDGAKFCAGCGAATGVAVNVPDSRSGGADSSGTNQGADRSADAVNQSRPQNVENHIVKAVISTLLCIPLGVVAIVFATKVKPALGAEDYEAAQIASKKANLWGNLALIIGIVIYAIQLSFVAVPRFSQASGKAKLAEATRVIASFESAYLVALADGMVDIKNESDLIFTAPDDSKSFKYEYVTYPQGGIAGYKATALKNIGKFNEGSFLQTVYQEDSDTFTHCVGGNEANVGVVKELIPNFNATVGGCSSVDEDDEQQNVAAPTQQNTASGTFTDSRDGKKYKIIKVGTQTWMAENLNYAAKGSVCYENNEANCVKYGRLYDWAAMGVSGCLSDYPNGVQGVCPAGWRLPSTEEWSEYGFSALPGGYYSEGRFREVGNTGEWWAGGADDGCYVWSWSGVLSRYGDGDDIKFSVRCVQD